MVPGLDFDFKNSQSYEKSESESSENNENNSLTLLDHTLKKKPMQVTLSPLFTKVS